MNNYRKLAKSILTATAFIALSAFTAVKPPTGFSGEWKLNESKSDLGQFGQFAPRKLKVDATANAATVERTSAGQNGEERVAKETLTFDGKEIESTVFGNSKRKSTVKWAEDSQTMTVTSTTLFDQNGQSMEIKGTETWKLLDGGKTLQIESTSNSSFGNNTMKLVYDKVQ